MITIAIPVIAFSVYLLLPVVLSASALIWALVSSYRWAGTPSYALPSVFFERWEMPFAVFFSITIWLIYYFV